MKVEPRVAVLSVFIGGMASTLLVLLALQLPLEGFLLLLFPSFIFWIIVPFLLLWLWRRFAGRP